MRKELSFCGKTNTRVLGVVENMAGFVCPHCAECTDIFSKGGGEIMAREYGVPFLGRVPIDPMFGRLIEEGVRPEYPPGTVVGGVDFGGMGGEGEGGDVEGGLLVDKYRRCSLMPIFEGIVKELVVGFER